MLSVLRRASAFSMIPWRHSEALQLVSYEQGEHFAPHTDYFKPTDQLTAAAGQRLWSGLLYLNSAGDMTQGQPGADFEGGETFFPLLNLTVVPRRGTVRRTGWLALPLSHTRPRILAYLPAAAPLCNL
eukprot:SAG11_NODE_10469_length_829_cov_1.731507_1_plen_128_part_00